MKLAKWLLPLVSLAIVLMLTWWDVGRGGVGPGPLHPAHARLAELASADGCEQCHQSGAGIDAQACARCHAPIGKQLAAKTGLHGHLPADQAQRCELCHGEHHGDSAPLIAPHAFPRLGIAEAKDYDHRDVVGFHLTGAHQPLACVRCHVRANDVNPPEGGRFLGLSQACESCHDDAHKGAYGSDCASCHGQQEKFAKVPGFRHQVFALAGVHREVRCDDCHRPGSDRAVAALKALKDQPAPRTCNECHADPHAGAPGTKPALRLADTADCKRCHDESAWRAARVTPERHAEYGFALRGPHATAECAACHGAGDAANGGKPARWTGVAPKLEACAVCHEHPHQPELIAAAVAARGPAQGCAGCHGDADTSFRAGTMTAEQHAATGFALAAPHAEVACADCHKGSERAQRFPGRKQDDCRACHADVHKGQFAHEARYGQCTACHLTTSFHPAQFGSAAHAQTAFPLTGAHDALACAACHRAPAAGEPCKFAGTSTSCADCHADVHKGAFDKAGRPKVVAGKSGCARCHDTAAFAPVAGAFDHKLWTGYELLGAHQQVDCAKCHPRTAAAGGTSLTRLGPALGQRCEQCHADPHAGQFLGVGGTDCARCHGQQDFHTLHFDHQRTRFPLDATHAKVECARCHTAYDTPRGPLVRYKPLGLTCGDCHQLGAGGEVRK